MESFIQKNKENNQNFENLTLICDDVMNLSFPEDRYLVIKHFVLLCSKNLIYYII